MHPLGLGFRPATLKSLSRTQITGCMSLPHDTVLSRRPGAVFANQKQRQGAAVDIMALTVMKKCGDHGRVHAPCVVAATHLAIAS